MKMNKLTFVLLSVVASFGLSLEPPKSHVKGGLRASDHEHQASRGGRELTSPLGNPFTYTKDEHFYEGSLVNCNYVDVPDQIQLDSKSTPINFIFVAASSRGTVVKVNTDTGEILGEYRTTPQSQIIGNPSRTTIDNDGSVWVANRNDVYDWMGSVVHIGLLENDQCEDRNGNGIIDTSTGLGDIKGWTDTSLTTAAVPGTEGRPVMMAEDECIVHYTKVNSRGTRHVSVDGDNNVWVGGYSLRNFDLVKGGRYDVPGSGTIIRSESSVGYGGYGGIMDKNGVIWSANYLLRWDPANPLTGQNGDPSGKDIGPPISGRNWAGQSGDSYGLCSDSNGNVWNTQLYGNQIHKYQFGGKHLGGYAHGYNNAQGCAVDKHHSDHIWVAHCLWGTTTIGHIRNDGTTVGNVNLQDVTKVIDTLDRIDPRIKGQGPTGVAVDGKGKIWSANYNSNSLSRIDPSLNGGIGGVDLTVYLGDGAVPYNYGDMTGNELISPPNHGTWVVTHDTGEVGAEWQKISWNEESVPGGGSHTPAGSILKVEVAALTSPIDPPSWQAVTNGQSLSIVGKYLKIRVSFVRAAGGKSPILTDITASIRIEPSSSPSLSPSSDPTSCPSESVDPSPYPSITIKPSPSPSLSPKPSLDPSDTVKPSPYPSKSLKPSPLPSDSPKPSPSPSDTVEPSPSPTKTVVPSPSPSNTVKPSPSPSDTVKPSVSPSDTMEPSLSPSDTVEPSLLPSATTKPSSFPMIPPDPIEPPTPPPLKSSAPPSSSPTELIPKDPQCDEKDKTKKSSSVSGSKDMTTKVKKSSKKKHFDKPSISPGDDQKDEKKKSGDKDKKKPTKKKRPGKKRKRAKKKRPGKKRLPKPSISPGGQKDEKKKPSQTSSDKDKKKPSKKKRPVEKRKRVKKKRPAKDKQLPKPSVSPGGQKDEKKKPSQTPGDKDTKKSTEKKSHAKKKQL